MSPTLRRTVVVVFAAFGVAVLLAWASASGPSRLVDEGSSGIAKVQELQRDQQDDPRKQDRLEHRSGQTQDPSWTTDLLTTLGLLISLLFFGIVVRGMISRISARLPDKRLVIDVATLPDGDPDTGREVLARDEVRQREALELSDVRDGIVRCWVLLEEAAGEAGVVHLQAETATEFVVRFLHALDVDPRPVGDLATLYLEARFSTHVMGEDARERARAALAGIHAELAGVRA